MSSPELAQPSPQLFFQTINSYQRTEALRAAIELEVFTAIAEGKATTAEIARRCEASERGVRILCDFLCMMGFLTKDDIRYSLTQDSAIFLDKHSPAYLGGITEFILSPELTAGFDDLAAAVRKGGTVVPDDGTVGHDNPIWVKFARAMVAMMAMPAQLIAQMIDTKADGKLKILDIAAGHGMFGIAFAARNPNAEIVALDWSNVLDVAKENAERAGVSDRIDLRIAPALDTIAALPPEPSIDLVFIDADKPNYANYFDAVLPRMRTNGLILVDNVLWSGNVVDPAVNDANTVAIRAFNDKVANDARVEAVMLPLSDGLTLLRVR